MHRFTNSTHPLDLAPRLYKRIDSSDLFSTHLLSEYLLDEKCGAPAGPVCLRWLALATVAGPRTTLDDDPRKWTVVISLDDDDSDAPPPFPIKFGPLSNPDGIGAFIIIIICDGVFDRSWLRGARRAQLEDRFLACQIRVSPSGIRAVTPIPLTFPQSTHDDTLQCVLDCFCLIVHSKVCNFDIYRPVWAVHIGPLGCRYADRKIDHRRLISAVAGRLREKKGRRRRGKEKKEEEEKKKKKRRRKPSACPRPRFVGASSLVDRPCPSPPAPARGDRTSPCVGRKIEATSGGHILTKGIFLMLEMLFLFTLVKENEK
ncbi:hypothetical protein BHM03_00052985 [Ensete ventricosum]|nr:hypothetical protein BHM03_00052985 [Ensete ventricosum]